MTPRSDTLIKTNTPDSLTLSAEALIRFQTGGGQERAVTK